MFGSSQLPDPLGGGGGAGGQPAGDGFVAVSVVADIIPVRIINTNALDVRVMNFPGVPPPLPGLRPSATPPPLPGGMPPVVSRPAKEAAGGGISLGDLGFSRLAALGTVAGAAAAGIGLVVGGLNELKSTFIDPILGAAKGGLDAGIAKGMGTGVLQKSFEVLGTTIGVLLLPTIVELAASALDAADSVRRNKSDLSSLIRAFGYALEALPMIGPQVKMFRKVQRAAAETPEHQHNIDKVLDALSRSVGAQPSFVGVADIRAQAQMAALQDPLEAQMRKDMIDAINEFRTGTSPAIKNIDQNTKPPGGGAA